MKSNGFYRVVEDLKKQKQKKTRKYLTGVESLLPKNLAVIFRKHTKIQGSNLLKMCERIVTVFNQKVTL